MTQLTARDIRKLTPTERKKKLAELYDQLSSIRISMATGGGTENPFRSRLVKKAIARLLTVERESELEATK